MRITKPVDTLSTRTRDTADRNGERPPRIRGDRARTDEKPSGPVRTDIIAGLVVATSLRKLRPAIMIIENQQNE
jgi:hypothetical protein